MNFIDLTVFYLYKTHFLNGVASALETIPSEGAL